MGLVDHLHGRHSHFTRFICCRFIERLLTLHSLHSLIPILLLYIWFKWTGSSDTSFFSGLLWIIAYDPSSPFMLFLFNDELRYTA